MLCIHRTITVDRIGIPGSTRYLIVSKTGNSVYCVRFQEDHIKSTCFYCARTYLLVCTQYYGPIYFVFLRPNCVLLLIPEIRCQCFADIYHASSVCGTGTDLFLGMVLSPYKNKE